MYPMIIIYDCIMLYQMVSICFYCAAFNWEPGFPEGTHFFDSSNSDSCPQSVGATVWSPKKSAAKKQRILPDRIYRVTQNDCCTCPSPSWHVHRVFHNIVMAPRVVGLAAAVLGVAAVTFVAPSTSGARRLRTPVAQPAASFGTSAESNSLYGICSAVGGVALLAAGAAVIRRAESKELTIEAIPRPEDLLDSPKFPMFEGGTGGYMSRSIRERHAITWTSKEQIKFEMPTGGYAIMNKGENLCYFRKKEQCIALGKQLRKMKIENYKIYRLKKDGTVIFMHPADGVFPEKVNKGRVQVNGRPFTIRSNPQQSELKWTKYHMKSYAARLK